MVEYAFIMPVWGKKYIDDAFNYTSKNYGEYLDKLINDLYE